MGGVFSVCFLCVSKSRAPRLQGDNDAGPPCKQHDIRTVFPPTPEQAAAGLKQLNVAGKRRVISTILLHDRNDIRYRVFLAAGNDVKDWICVLKTTGVRRRLEFIAGCAARLGHGCSLVPSISTSSRCCRNSLLLLRNVFPDMQPLQQLLLLLLLPLLW